MLAKQALARLGVEAATDQRPLGHQSQRTAPRPLFVSGAQENLKADAVLSQEADLLLKLANGGFSQAFEIASSNLGDVQYALLCLQQQYDSWSCDSHTEPEHTTKQNGPFVGSTTSSKSSSLLSPSDRKSLLRSRDGKLASRLLGGETSTARPREATAFARLFRAVESSIEAEQLPEFILLLRSRIISGSCSSEEPSSLPLSLWFTARRAIFDRLFLTLDEEGGGQRSSSAASCEHGPRRSAVVEDMGGRALAAGEEGESVEASIIPRSLALADGDGAPSATVRDSFERGVIPSDFCNDTCQFYEHHSHLSEEDSPSVMETGEGAASPSKLLGFSKQRLLLWLARQYDVMQRETEEKTRQVRTDVDRDTRRLRTLLSQRQGVRVLGDMRSLGVSENKDGKRTVVVPFARGPGDQ